MPKITLDMEVFEWKDGQTVISSKFAFEMFTVYGFPVELLEEEVNSRLKPGSFARTWHVAHAYDKAHGTNLADNIRKEDFIESNA